MLSINISINRNEYFNIKYNNKIKTNNYYCTNTANLYLFNDFILKSSFDIYYINTMVECLTGGLIRKRGLSMTSPRGTAHEKLK